jgi:MoaA/NifB/PqqE/SkfB family radical SAM enzyme
MEEDMNGRATREVIICQAVHAIVLHDSRCTNNCVFCGTRDFGAIKENVRAELKRLRAAVETGEKIDVVEISGNDPGEYAELPTLVSNVRLLVGTCAIRLASHGKTLADEEFVHRLVDAGITEFIIPFYGHTSRVHDGVTRTPGSFVNSILGLTNVVKAGVRHTLTVLITKENQAYLTEVLLFVASLVSEVSVGVPYLGTPGFRDSVPDFDMLRGQLSSAVQAVRDEGRCIIRLRNLPRCLVNPAGAIFEESREPPVGAYEHWRRSQMLNSGFVEILNDRVIPRYRLFSKTRECKQCCYEGNCAGFFTTYIDHGLFKPNPVSSETNADGAPVRG